ncbi:MAG TPA: class I SAM-dependent methyltransferase [Brumimicrobium sp.]|nr:class I SAM-dependent methyltransferase [Brumimicrobium sp.]
MLRLIREYIKYCFNAKRRHGIHSPFVYDFGDKCLTQSVPDYEYGMFKALKASLLKNKHLITVNDMGAGSKRLKKQRSVQQIAKVSGSNDKYGKLLYRLVAYYKPQHVLELGTSLGLGTFMLAAGHEDVSVTTVEGCHETYDFARRGFPSSQHHKVKFVNSSFTNYLKAKDESPIFDLVFIDGDHQSKSLFEQLELLENHIHDETIIVLDDIRWSKDMLQAWNKVFLKGDYHLTLDLFKVGIIVKRVHQQKEHFVIRY